MLWLDLFLVVCFLAQSVSVTGPGAVLPATKASFLRHFNSSSAGDSPDSPRHAGEGGTGLLSATWPELN